jgi:Domain of unknown function (DUF4936)
MRELFIYYRLRSVDAPTARLVVQEFQTLLCKRYPQLIARLLYRPEHAHGIETWMETYSTDPAQSCDGVSVGLQSDIEAHAFALAPLLASARHTEVFVACAS